MDLVRFISCFWLLVAVNLATTSANEGSNDLAFDVREQPLVPSEQLELPKNGDKSTKPISYGKEPEIEIMEIAVSEDEVSELMALHDDIEREAIEAATVSARTTQSDVERSSRALINSEQESVSEMLDDDDIAKLVQMISFPSKTMENVGAEQSNSTAPEAAGAEVASVQVEPRSNQQRGARALNSRGYYVLAFLPVGGPPQSTYTKFDIIPAERALEGDLAMKRAKKQRNGSDFLMSTNGVNEEERLLSKKKFNRYVRRLMKQIRKGTRKIQRKTRFKSKSAEPTVENFLRKLYSQREAAQKTKKSAWFSW